MNPFSLALFAAVALHAVPAASAEPYVCSEADPACEGTVCIAARTLGDASPVRDVVFVDDETPACLVVEWPECTVEVVSPESRLCIDPSARDCPVQQHRDGGVSCVGFGSTDVGFGDCHASVRYGATALCVDPDGPCFVAVIEGAARTCVAGLPA